MNKLIVIFTIIGILLLFWFCFFPQRQTPIEIDINAGNAPPIKIQEKFSEPNTMTKKIINNDTDNKISF